MKQTRSLSKLSSLSEYTPLYPNLLSLGGNVGGTSGGGLVGVDGWGVVDMDVVTDDEKLGGLKDALA